MSVRVDIRGELKNIGYFCKNSYSSSRIFLELEEMFEKNENFFLIIFTSNYFSILTVNSFKSISVKQLNISPIKNKFLTI